MQAHHRFVAAFLLLQSLKVHLFKFRGSSSKSQLSLNDAVNTLHLNPIAQQRESHAISYYQKHTQKPVNGKVCATKWKTTKEYEKDFLKTIAISMGWILDDTSVI